MKVSLGEPLAMIVSAIGLELSMGSKRANAMCAATKKTVMVSADAYRGRHVLPFSRSSQPAIGPISSAMAASAAGSRSAANDSPVKSNRCDIESV